MKYKICPHRKKKTSSKLYKLTLLLDRISFLYCFGFDVLISKLKIVVPNLYCYRYPIVDCILVTLSDLMFLPDRLFLSALMQYITFFWKQTLRDSFTKAYLHNQELFTIQILRTVVFATTSVILSTVEASNSMVHKLSFEQKQNISYVTWSILDALSVKIENKQYTAFRKACMRRARIRWNCNAHCTLHIFSLLAANLADGIKHGNLAFPKSKSTPEATLQNGVSRIILLAVVSAMSDIKHIVITIAPLPRLHASYHLETSKNADNWLTAWDLEHSDACGARPGGALYIGSPRKVSKALKGFAGKVVHFIVRLDTKSTAFRGK